MNSSMSFRQVHVLSGSFQILLSLGKSYVVCSLNSLMADNLPDPLPIRQVRMNQNLFVPDNWMALFLSLKFICTTSITCRCQNVVAVNAFFNTFQLQCTYRYMYSFILERFLLYMYLIHGNYTVVLTLYICILLSVKRRHKQWCRCIEETS